MRVIISAGGTGGHIYPALSIIDKIKKMDKNAEILYIGTTDRMEKDIIPQHNIDYYGIKVRGFDRKLSFSNFRTVKYFIKAVMDVKKVIKEYKPDIVIGVGGYVTAPVIYAAKKCGIKTIIHEQNSVLGMTNRFLSKYVNAVAISFKNTKVNAKKVVYTGNPSSEIDSNIKFNKSEFGLSENKPLILIVMGSLGSKVVTEKMKNILPMFNDKYYEILYISGKDYYEEFKSLKLKSNVLVVPYVDNMKRMFKKVDVMVTRAGATTMSEIIAYKVVSILVPSKYVTDNHQYKNAKSLVDRNAALLIEEDNLTGELLIKNIEELLMNKEKINTLRTNLSSMYIPNSADKIYELIIETINGR
jgi:UDP-N-acetylglucosamine--N-acetylmuramyl-(pentapeptide) pyrophosphoryl-undecaprenol N-acetylglucosamine transferase